MSPWFCITDTIFFLAHHLAESLISVLAFLRIFGLTSQVWFWSLFSDLEIHVLVRRLGLYSLWGQSGQAMFWFAGFPFRLELWTMEIQIYSVPAGGELGEYLWSVENFQNVWVQSCVSICIYAWETCLEASWEFRELRISNRGAFPSPAPLLLYRWGIGITASRIQAPGNSKRVCPWLWVPACCPLKRVETTVSQMCENTQEGKVFSPQILFLTVSAHKECSPWRSWSTFVLLHASWPVVAVLCLLALISELDWKLLEDERHPLSVIFKP